MATRHAARLARRATGACIDRFHPFNSRSITDADSNILCARTSFTADEIDTIYNDLWAAGYVLHCTDIEDGEVVVPTVDRLREIGDVLHDICDGLLEPDEADAGPRR